ncbi:MAG TPA: HAD-IIIA family hydrolase [Acidimicrobiales bacterium]|nr:HAD-IIIA family hydrolase [Acidimicrobiales bacterium]
MSGAGGTGRRAVFLDRDGVVNEAVVRDGRPYPPGSPDDVVVVAGMPEACARLRSAGFAVVVVTNQPDVARGRQSAGAVAAINAAVRRQVEVDGLYACLHDDADGCGCRKPKPGMLVAGAADLGLDLGRSFMVGDRWSDVAAGREAGCTTVYIDRGYEERRAEGYDHVAPDPVAAVDWIIGTSQGEEGGRVRSSSLRHQGLR